MLPLDIAIDVSDNNGEIDWPAVFGAGIRIAFVKAMEGVGLHYPTWGPQSEGAAKAGLVVIPYMFLRPVDAKLAVSHFRSVTGLGKGMAFALDWEGRANQSASAQTAEDIGEELAIVANRKPIGYWGIPGSTPSAPTAVMATWPRWVPRYPVSGVNSWDALPPAPQKNPGNYWLTGRIGAPLPYFGQYSAWGRIRGINGLVDRSVAFFPSIEDALAWCRVDGAATPLDAATPAGVNTAPTPASPIPAAPSAPAAGDPGDQQTNIEDSEPTTEELNDAELDRLAGQGGAR
jgi:lysozyme